LPTRHNIFKVTRNEITLIPNMPVANTPSRVRSAAIATALFFAVLLVPGCKNAKSPSFIGTFPMGERVQLGPLTYNVLETEWKNQLSEGAAGKVPANRYLLVKMSITNGGGGNVAVPLLTVEDASGHAYSEVTEGTDAVQDWLGLLRNLAPAQNDNGVAIFDVPMGGYKLRISDGGEIGNEKTALIDIPVHIQ
jgi:hypothetical protein